MREIRRAIIHCSDTYKSMDWGAEEIRRVHVEENGWRDIGYHYIIKRDGTVDSGRDLDGDGDILEEVGAHAYGFNADSIGICLIGGKSNGGTPDFNFTARQFTRLITLVRGLKELFPDLEVIGHRDVSYKDCPCFDVKALFDGAF